MSSLPKFKRTGKVYRAADKFRKAALDGNDRALLRMIGHYQKQHTVLASKLEAVLLKIETAKASGELISPAWLFQSQRYQELIRQTNTRLTGYVGRAGGIITDQQRAGILKGADDALNLLKTSAGNPPPGFGLNWAKLNTEPMLNLAGYTQAGQPVANLMAGVPAEVSKAMTDNLLIALETGVNPQVAARQIYKALEMPLQRALCICRTEFMRSYRQAHNQTYEANADIIKGWVWSIDPSARTCAACWAMEGSVHPVSESLNDHPNGRCTPIPLTKSWQELFPGVDMEGVEDTAVQPVPGAERFAKLSDKDQRTILGKTRYEAYKAGTLNLEDVAGTQHSKIWGDSIAVKPIRDTPGVDLPDDRTSPV